MLKSLLYILKLSIIPVLIITFGKLVGIYVAGFLLDIEIVTNTNDLLSLLNPGVYANDIQNVSTFSNLFMFALLSIGTTVILIQSSIFHDTHIDLSVLSKLANLNLMFLIRSTYQVYHWGFVWAIYLIIGSLTIFVDYSKGLIALWIPVVAFLFSIFSLLVLFKDVYNEINIAKKYYEQH